MRRAPERIVSLVPSQTELLADLGLDAEVLGITRFCVHPDDWRSRKTIVGGTKDVSVEKLRGLAPDLILANREENTRETVEALGQLAPVHVTDVSDLAQALRMIRAVGEMVGRAQRALELCDSIQAGFDALPEFVPRTAAYLIWRDPWMSVGGDCFIHDMLGRAGMRNVFAHRKRYPPLTSDELMAAAPELLLLSSEPYPFAAKHVEELRLLLPPTRVCLVDGELFSWYGSRLERTPAYLRALRAELDRGETS